MSYVLIKTQVILVTHGGGLAARPRFYLCCRSAVSRHIWGASGESVGSSCGPASQEALSRHLSTPNVHPCWGKSSLYLYAFRTNQTRNRVFLTKFTISAGFGHHAANFTQSVQPQGLGWQNDDKNDDKRQKMMTVLVKKVKLWFFKVLIFNDLQTKNDKWWQWQQKKDIPSHMQKTWTQNLYIFIYIYILIYIIYYSYNS